MSRLLASIDRLIVFFLGLLALLGGSWSIGLFFNAPYSQRLADRIDNQLWLGAYHQEWFIFAAIAVVLLSILFSVLIITSNLRRHRITRVSSDASTPQGLIAYNLNQIGRAVTETLDDPFIHINSVSHKEWINRGRATMEFTIHAEGTINVEDLIPVIEQAESDIRSAVEDLDLDIVFKIHLGRLD